MSESITGNGVVPLPPPLTENNADKNESIKPDTVLDALNLMWCFGYNKEIGLLNLCVNDSRKLFLTSSHIGIIYDFAANSQKLLQGHQNNITCCTVNEDKRWLITADAGADSTIIVWDMNTCLPVQTYFNTHEEGVVSVAMSADSKYIASLSAQHPQVLALWEWTTDSEVPICTAQLDEKFGPQANIRFNPENSAQIVTNSDTQVIFYEWTVAAGFIFYAPVINDQTFHKPVGKLTQSLFQSHGSNRVLTATSLGNLVIWQTIDMKNARISDKKAFKLFKLQERAINVLTLMNDIIVIGDSDGHVKFIDQNLHVLMWYRHLLLGPVNSLSFSHKTKDYSGPPDNIPKIDKDATLEYNKFICKDFLVSTNAAKIGFVQQSATELKVICVDSDSTIVCLATHPTLNRLCFGNYVGYIQLWDYETKKLISTKKFDGNLQISSMAFNHSGTYIAIGFKNGHLHLIDAITLEECLKGPFTYSKAAISNIQFSHDSRYMATADSDFTVSVYKYNFIGENQTNIATELYTCLGRYRSHYKEIVGLMFGVGADTQSTRLVSLGKDRHMIEYDLENSNYDELLIKDKCRIEQYAVPLAMVWHPQISKESSILTVNDQWKYKLYNSTTKMCRKTLLGPIFGSHLKKMNVITNGKDHTQGDQIMAYITENKLGLQQFPLHGNPYDSIAILAHPNGVTNFASSFDGKYLFTTGGDNNNVFMWATNFKSLKAQSILGGADLKPFYELIEGGRDGPLFKEMRELFYYSQLRHNGLNQNVERLIKLTIPLSEIPFIMRGLGFFPTEQEIEIMMNEVKFSRYLETNEYVEEINIDDLLRLYVNHRPAFGLDPYLIHNAFSLLGEKLNSSAEDYLPRNVFLSELQTKGEHMTEYELADCVSNLLHTNHQVDEMSTDQMLRLLDKYLPEKMRVDNFMSDIIGVPIDNFEEILQRWEALRVAHAKNIAKQGNYLD